MDCGTPSGPDLEKDIAAITTILERMLLTYAVRRHLNIEEKLSKIEGRTTIFWKYG